VDRVKRSLTAGQFVGWLAYFEFDDEQRSKLDHYLVAVRHDLHQLIQLVRSFGGQTPQRVDVEELFLTGKSAEEASFRAPEGYEFDPDDPVKGSFDKGYGLPGIELDETDKLDEKWQKVNDLEKQKWQAWARMTGLIHHEPAPGSTADG
jgi:hypothetical protein